MVEFQIKRERPASYFTGDRGWKGATPGIVPGAGKDGLPRVVIVASQSMVEGSDVYKGIMGIWTDDLGETWTGPKFYSNLDNREMDLPNIGQAEVALSDIVPKWHAASGTLLATGNTTPYQHEDQVKEDRAAGPDGLVRVARPSRRDIGYTVYKPEEDQWAQWKSLQVPPEDPFLQTTVGHSHRVDKPNGAILLPFQFRNEDYDENWVAGFDDPSVQEESSSRLFRYSKGKVSVMECTFDGETLRYRQHGDVLRVFDDTRGLGEPQLTYYNGTYYLTLRNDERGYVTRSEDGLHYEEIREWTFDDGEPLGSYNTQQHWVTHSDGLFLVYTRRGADNDHVIRHRAPLFIAEVDTETLTVRRETERVLVPERGARLGCFGVCSVTPEETWVTTNEWLQHAGIESRQERYRDHDCDGSLWVARIRWDEPNRLLRKERPRIN